MLASYALRSVRFTAILSALATLVPALKVKGRDQDPLQYASWWSGEYHSGVLPVVGGTLLGVLLFYLLYRFEVKRWSAYVACGTLVGVVPGFFYLAATPPRHLDAVPIAAMLGLGLLWGVGIGIAVYFVHRTGR
jgi:hypothetical protein